MTKLPDSPNNARPSTSQPLPPTAESFGICPNTARMAPSISDAVRKRSHVTVTGSTVRRTMVSAMGSTPQNAAVTTANARPSFQRPLSLCTDRHQLERHVLHVPAIDVQVLPDGES